MDAEEQLIHEIKDKLLAWIDLHRKNCLAADCGEPSNALAFLAHCAGLGVKQVPEFAQRLSVYETNCANCPHLRN